jgi:phosphate transport system substrate-binding protein
VLHVPTALGAVVPVYRLDGVQGPLNFPGPVLAGIVMGAITKWNDPALAAANPGIILPAMDITFVHRSDGSGTSFIFCDYLAKVSPEFGSKVGVATSVAWPAGVGAKGNEGVAGLVRQTPGALGYVELIYAIQNKIDYGAVQNVRASLASVTAAAAGAAASMPGDFRVSLVNAPGADAYPIASFTWILLREDGGDLPRSRAMVDFLRWALTDGQATAESLGYARVPPEVAEKTLAALARVRT